MKRTHSLLTLAFFLGFGLVAGCATPPTEELTAAEQALTRAREAQVDAYLADTYQEAEHALDSARVLIETKEAANYTAARAMLMQAQEQANMAVEQVEARKEAVRAEAETALAETEADLAELKKQLPRMRRAARATAQQGIDAVTTTLGEVRAALEAGDLLGARDLAQEARQRVAAMRAS